MEATKHTGRGSPAEDASVPGPGIQEVAVYLSRITDLPFREAIHWKRLVATVGGDPAGDARHGADPDLRALLCHEKERARPVRVYFGNEFCELRVPGRREFEDSCMAVRRTGLPFTFVTPPATDNGCETLFDRLTDLQDWLPGSEVVVNDWGLLQLVHEAFPSLTPVLGRLLSRFLRDPRVTPLCDRPGVSPEARSALRKCSLNISAYRELLTRYGVDRVELDNLYQGIDMDFRSLGLRPSLYVPHGYVTTGRICMPGNEHLPREHKFGMPSGPCPRPCMRVEIGLADGKRREDGGVYDFTQRGNTIFYSQSDRLVAQGQTWAAQQGARLVYQPEIPF